MEDVLVPVLIVGMLFIGLPWLILHYVSQWKKGASLTREDENLLDELYDLARRLEDRVETVERIMTADDPSWKSRT
jgi:phage shock protein B